MNENLTPEQAEIFQFARSGHNILITGTVVWSLWKERLKEGRKRTVLADNSRGYTENFYLGKFDLPR